MALIRERAVGTFCYVVLWEATDYIFMTYVYHLEVWINSLQNMYNKYNI